MLYICILLVIFVYCVMMHGNMNIMLEAYCLLDPKYGNCFILF
jgi:hypothetical protein